MGDLEGLYEKLKKVKGRRGVSRVKIKQLAGLLKSKLEGADVVYIRAKDIVKDSGHFEDPRYVGVCLSTLKEITPLESVPLEIEKYSKSWKIKRAASY